MAEIVLGIGTSHSPMLSLTPDMWSLPQEGDKRNTDIVDPSTGYSATYEEVLAKADPKIAGLLTQERFDGQYEACQKAIATLEQTMADANPDVVVIISDDQDEWFFDHVMPSFAIYWGNSVPIVPNRMPEGSTSPYRHSMWGYGDVEMDVPVDSALGLHLIESLIDGGFDVAHFCEVKEQYGGDVSRWYQREGNGHEPVFTRTTQPRRQGLPHGFAFIVRRIMNGKTVPIVPVFQNTCYPPNQPTPRRSYALGKAIGEAVKSWDSDKRVCVVGSGGLSHFVVDEEVDQLALKGMRERDGALLGSLPRRQLNSAASEIQNWIAASATVEHLEMELLEYVPVYRSPAGTGGGWCFARWQ